MRRRDRNVGNRRLKSIVEYTPSRLFFVIRACNRQTETNSPASTAVAEIQMPRLSVRNIMAGEVGRLRTDFHLGFFGRVLTRGTFVQASESSVYLSCWMVSGELV